MRRTLLVLAVTAAFALAGILSVPAMTYDQPVASKDMTYD